MAALGTRRLGFSAGHAGAKNEEHLLRLAAHWRGWGWCFLPVWMTQVADTRNGELEMVVPGEVDFSIILHAVYLEPEVSFGQGAYVY